MNKLKKQNILYLPSYNYLSEPIFENLIQYMKEFNNICYDIGSCYYKKIEKSEIFDKYYFLNYNKNTKNNKLITLSKILYQKKNIVKVIKKISPSIIISTTDLGFPIKIIRKVLPNIPFVVIQSALFNYEENTYNKLSKFLYLIDKQKNYLNEYEDTHLLLWGKFFEKNIKTNNQNIYCTGNIAFDNLPFKEKSKYILIGTSVLKEIIGEKSEQKLLDIIIHFIKKNQNLKFIIKPHPRDDIDLITKLFNFPNIQISQVKIENLLKNASVYITFNSATLLTALAMKVPIINILSQELLKYDILKNQFNERVFDVNELEKKVKYLIANPEEQFYSNNINNLLCSLDRKAAYRASNVIKGILCK